MKAMVTWVWKFFSTPFAAGQSNIPEEETWLGI
jgi:hypothetical protein